MIVRAANEQEIGVEERFSCSFFDRLVRSGLSQDVTSTVKLLIKESSPNFFDCNINSNRNRWD